MKQITFRNNHSVPVLGQGTWQMGLSSSDRKQEVDALQYGIDQGMTLIDTAEMYNDAELVVGEAIKGRRDDVYLVSKVLPGNASTAGTQSACETSLKRLKTECIDLYLLHWSGRHPIEDTLEGFQRLVDQGKIRSYGVSNLDLDDMHQAWDAPGGESIATNQLLYNLQHRGIEWSLLPWCRKNRVPVMAYSPLNQGQLPPDVLEPLAMRHNANRFQIALAWLLHQPDVIVIPKAVKQQHIDQNLAALNINLTNQEIKQINKAFPPPARDTPLEMI